MIMHLDRILALIISAAAIITMGCWFFSQHLVFNHNNELLFMTFNTSLCFSIVGAFYFFRRDEPLYNLIEIIIGAFLILVGTIVYCESVLNLPINIDELFVKVITDGDIKNPGRMSTLTATGFITSGLVMILTKSMKTTFMYYVVHLLILTIFFMSIFGVIQNEIFNVISSKYIFNRMSFASTILLILLSVVLWMDWHRVLAGQGFQFDDYNMTNFVKVSIVYFAGLVAVLTLIALGKI